MRYLIVLCALLLAGCLTSKEPLITSSDFPLPSGTVLRQYDFLDGKYVPKKNDGVGELTIREGWYFHKTLGKEDKAGSAFKLKRVDDSNWVAMFYLGSTKGPQRAYGWARRVDDMYVIYPVNARHFKAWAERVGLRRQGWREVKSAIEVDSLALLEKALPSMIEGGHHMTVMAYRVVEETPEIRKGREELAKVNEALAKIEAEIERNDNRLRKMCGGRVCLKSKSGKEVYRTETHDPPKYYYEDGRLAPRSDWPR